MNLTDMEKFVLVIIIVLIIVLCFSLPETIKEIEENGLKGIVEEIWEGENDYE
jgi:competence protein ComGC